MPCIPSAGGIPRVINLLSEHSLICAYVRNLQPVPAFVVDKAAREFQLDDAKRPIRPGDFADATTAQSTFMKSIFANADSPSLAAPPTLEGQPTSRTSPTSVPFVVAKPMTDTNSGSKPSSSAYESTSVRRAFTEAMRRETEQFLSAELSSEDAFRLLCEFALKSQAIAAAPAIYEVESSRDIPRPAQPSSASHLETSAPQLMTTYGTVQTLESTSETQSRKLRTWQVRRRSWRALHWSA